VKEEQAEYGREGVGARKLEEWQLGKNGVGIEKIGIKKKHG
jgi:hypothetical protein